MPSSIPTARQNLHSLLQTAFSGQDVQVVFGWPDQFQDRQVVALLGVERVDTELAAVGGQRSQEDYQIRMRIRVWLPGGNAADDGLQLDQDAWGIYETIRATVAANKTLGGALQDGWARLSLGDAEDSPTPVTDGLQHAVNLTVAASSRIDD